MHFKRQIRAESNEFSFISYRPITAFTQRTVVWNKQESRHKYWATRSSVRLFACTVHFFACFRLLALLAPSAALTRSLACSLPSLPRSWESEFLMSQNDLVLSHSATVWLSSSSSLSSSIFVLILPPFRPACRETPSFSPRGG